MIFVAFAINIHNEVPFKKECFTNFFPFSSIPFTISDADTNQTWLEQRRIGEMFYINGTSKRLSNLNFFINHLTVRKN